MTSVLVSALKKVLDSHSWEEGVVWTTLEPETIILELNFEDSPLLRDKIGVIRVLEESPDLFFDDLLFFSHAVTVMNNEVTDFETIVLPTSLEVALGVVEMSIILHEKPYELPVFSEGIRSLVKYILVNEGYSKPIFPFNIFGVGKLTEGQTEQDTLDKERAIKTYVTAMYS